MKKKKVRIILEKIQVEDYAAEGKSLAKLDGKVIFIEGAIPGDVVDIQLNKNKKDWAEGHTIYFHSYSPERLEPFCSHFGVCGGCQWQMLPYEKQLLYKQRQVKDNLERIGKIKLPEIMPILGAEETKFYRNKIEYTFGTKEYTREKPIRTPTRHIDSMPGNQGLVQDNNKPANKFPDHSTTLTSEFKGLGFHARGFFDKIVDIQTCYLQAEPSNEIRLEIKRFAIEKEFSFYDIRNHTGLLRTMQIRLCRTGEIMVNIVFGENDKPRQRDLLEHILQKFPAITTLLCTLNMKMNDSLHDLDPVVYSGKGYVIENMSVGQGGEDFKFKIGPKSFFQTNTRQGEQLYRVTKDFAELTGNETVYDLYCGTGSIGIFVSKQAKKVIGVELVGAAIEDARENATLNNLNNASFFAGDVTAVCNDSFFEMHGRPDVIITDPPRAGMSEKLVRKIIEMAAPVVVYVSCNPATQARDLHLLHEKYEITKIQPVDMFPHTLHIENVVQLKLKNSV
ncbi:MAG: 23S rRNA (uracil(1939)-C(5))-methyltransferase RlmD [Chitinophagaceae bacterium]